MKSRHPRFRRAEDFPAMRLTARDTQILRVVNKHRFLRSHQVADLVGGSRQQTLRRLQKLYHHGYVHRPPCQLDYYQRGGSRAIVYGLDSRGAARLRLTESVPFSRLNQTPSDSGIKRLFLEHALMISDIMVAFELACRKAGTVRLLIDHEIPLPEITHRQRAPFRWTIVNSANEKVGVVPDRVFLLKHPDANRDVLCFLEADRGTMPVDRENGRGSSIVRKLLAYASTWKSGVHRSRFGVSRLRILTVTSAKERCAKICEATSKLIEGSGMFLQSTLTSEFTPETCLGSIWLNAKNRHVRLFDERELT